MRSDEMERKIYLEQLKRNTDSELVKRMSDILSRDISEDIMYDMRSEWTYLEVKSPFNKRKESKGNDDI